MLGPEMLEYDFIMLWARPILGSVRIVSEIYSTQLEVVFQFEDPNVNR